MTERLSQSLIWDSFPSDLDRKGHGANPGARALSLVRFSGMECGCCGLGRQAKDLPASVLLFLLCFDLSPLGDCKANAPSIHT